MQINFDYIKFEEKDEVRELLIDLKKRKVESTNSDSKREKLFELLKIDTIRNCILKNFNLICSKKMGSSRAESSCIYVLRALDIVLKMKEKENLFEYFKRKEKRKIDCGICFRNNENEMQYLQNRPSSLICQLCDIKYCKDCKQDYNLYGKDYKLYFEVCFCCFCKIALFWCHPVDKTEVISEFRKFFVLNKKKFSKVEQCSYFRFETDRTYNTLWKNKLQIKFFSTK